MMRNRYKGWSEQQLLAEKGRLLDQIGRALLGLMIFEAALFFGAIGLLILHGLGVI